MRRSGSSSASSLPNPRGLSRWSNYEFLPSPLLGFHGCDQSVGEAILSGEVKYLTPSRNDYDWLGTGIYFWEGNPERALQFAMERAVGGRNSRGVIRQPFVLGAVLNLKRCLDLADSSAIAQIKDAHRGLEGLSQVSGVPLPSNGLGLRTRKLDCAVINSFHQTREDEGLPAYDTVRGLFWEGAPIYPGAGVNEFNHIQICVRDMSCILGYFRPIELD